MKDLPIELILNIFTYFTEVEIVLILQLVCKEWYKLANSEFIVKFLLVYLKFPYNFYKRFKIENLTTIRDIIDQWNMYGPIYLIKNDCYQFNGLKFKWKMYRFETVASIHQLNAKIITKDNYHFKYIPNHDPFSRIAQIKGEILSDCYRIQNQKWINISVDEIIGIKEVETNIQSNVPLLTLYNEEKLLIENMGKLICWEGQIKAIVEEKKQKINIEGCKAPLMIEDKQIILKEKDKIKVIGRLDPQGIFHCENVKIIDASSYYQYAEDEIIILTILISISLIYSFIPAVRYIGAIVISLFGILLQLFLVYLLYDNLKTVLCFLIEFGFMILLYFFWNYLNFMSFFIGLGFIAWFIMISMIVLWNKFIKWFKQKIYLNSIKKNV